MNIRNTLKLLMIFNFFIVFCANGQAYHPLLTSNKYWDIFHGDNIPLCGSSGGDEYFVSSDTIIGGNAYKIILSHPIKSFQGAYCPPFYIDTSIIGPKAFIREDTLLRKVFINDNNVDEIIYDFSISINDTLISCNINIVDTITIDTLANGDLRKKIRFDNGSWCIEGIGGSNGLLNCLIVESTI